MILVKLTDIYQKYILPIQDALPVSLGLWSSYACYQWLSVDRH